MIRYTIIIQWSEEDKCFVVLLPEFEDVMQPVTHGETYEEAIQNAQEALQLLIESYKQEGKFLPKPITLGKSFQKQLIGLS
jgi:predicted RNase H-like HicB family nuclease